MDIKNFMESFKLKFYTNFNCAIYNQTTKESITIVSDYFFPNIKIAIDFYSKDDSSNIYLNEEEVKSNVKRMKEIGIDLIEIWENDWNLKQENIRRKIRRKINSKKKELKVNI